MGGTRLRPVGEGGHIIEDEGVPLPQQPALNFLGTGVTAADGAGKTNVTITSGGHTIEDEGTPVAQRTAMNFVGAGVTVTDAGGKTVVTIPGGAGGGGTSFPDTVPFKDNASTLDDVQSIYYSNFLLGSGGMLITADELLKQNGWSVDNSGGLSFNESAFLGGMGMETGGASGNGEAIWLESFSLSKDRDYNFKAIVHMADGVPLTDNMTIIGLTDEFASFDALVANAEANISEGAWFRYSQSNSANWQCRVKNDNEGIDSTTDSGVAVVAGIGARSLLQITYDFAAFEVKFFIAGNLVHTEDMGGKFSGSTTALVSLIAEAVADPAIVIDTMWIQGQRI